MAKHRFDWKRDSTRRLRTHRMFLAPPISAAYQPIYLRGGFPFEPFDQLAEGSCTSNAAVGLATFLQAKLGLPTKMLSRQFLYYNTREIEGTISTDSGATITDTITAWQRHGICDENLDPYLPENMTLRPSDAAYADANSELAMNKEQIAQDFDSLYTCLSAGYPIDFGMDVFESFESDETARTGIVPMPDESREDVLGGHSTLLVGVTQINNQWYFIGRNSWNTTWGDGGYYYIPAKYILSDHASDFWTVKMLPQATPVVVPTATTTLRILVVAGFLEHVGDSSAIWKIADALAVAGHVITRRAWNEVSTLDTTQCDVVVTYSWGMAMFHKVYSGAPIRRHIVLAGAPNPFLGQFLGSWTEPDPIVTATDYQVDSFPISIPLAERVGCVVINCDGPGVNHETLPKFAADRVIAEIGALT